MELELMNKLSELSVMGYYDPSSKLVTAWFYSDTGEKADLVAYLLPDMKWDLREVLDESAILEKDREVIEIKHKQLGVHEPGGDIDNLLRKALQLLIDYSEEEGHLSSGITMMKIVLENNSYYNVRN